MHMVPEDGGVSQQLVDALTHAVMTTRNGVRKSGTEIYFTCPIPEHDDAHPTARWNTAKATFFCNVCDVGGGALDLAARLHVDLPTETIFVVKDRHGAVVAEHVRVDHGGEKTCTWRRNGHPDLNGLKLTALPLYGIDKLAAVPPGSVVVITEGEKACQALWARGVVAVATVTGAGTIPADDVLRDLEPYAPIVWPDADDAGRGHMRHLGARLSLLGIEPWLVDPWPGKLGGEDAADFDGEDSELHALLDAALPMNAAWLRLATVQPEVVEWLWYGHVALGKVTILEGDPDEGKSCLALDLAARVTKGAAMPHTGDQREPAGVVFITAEDGLADTVRPRFDAAGGDPSQVIVFAPDEVPSLDADGMTRIEAAIRACGAKLVILDPLNAFVPDKVDINNDHHVRRALKPLFALAARTGVAVLVIRHLTKAAGGTNPKYRGGGSIGIFGFARGALLVAPDPDDASRKVLSVSKHNLCPEQVSLSYRMVGAVVGLITTVKVEWLGVSHYRAADLLAMPEPPKEGRRTAEAAEFLRTILAACPLPSGEVLKAARQAGISERTLQRARSKVATTMKGSMDDGWTWALKKSEAPSKHAAPSGVVAPSEPDGAIGQTPVASSVASSDEVAPSVSSSPPSEDAKDAEGANEDAKGVTEGASENTRDITEGATNPEAAVVSQGDVPPTAPGGRTIDL